MRRSALAAGGYESSVCGVWAAPEAFGVPCGTGVSMLSNTLADEEWPVGGASIVTKLWKRDRKECGRGAN